MYGKKKTLKLFYLLWNYIAKWYNVRGMMIRCYPLKMVCFLFQDQEDNLNISVYFTFSFSSWKWSPVVHQTQFFQVIAFHPLVNLVNEGLRNKPHTLEFHPPCCYLPHQELTRLRSIIMETRDGLHELCRTEVSLGDWTTHNPNTVLVTVWHELLRKCWLLDPSFTQHS